jgi:hypothetical protein
VELELRRVLSVMYDMYRSLVVVSLFCFFFIVDVLRCYGYEFFEARVGMRYLLPLFFFWSWLCTIRHCIIDCM